MHLSILFWGWIERLKGAVGSCQRGGGREFWKATQGGWEGVPACYFGACDLSGRGGWEGILGHVDPPKAGSSLQEGGWEGEMATPRYFRGRVYKRYHRISSIVYILIKIQCKRRSPVVTCQMLTRLAHAPNGAQPLHRVGGTNATAQ